MSTSRKSRPFQTVSRVRHHVQVQPSRARSWRPLSWRSLAFAMSLGQSNRITAYAVWGCTCCSPSSRHLFGTASQKNDDAEANERAYRELAGALAKRACALLHRSITRVKAYALATVLPTRTDRSGVRSSTGCSAPLLRWHVGVVWRKDGQLFDVTVFVLRMVSTS